jgi:hypothetical protein
MSSVVLAERALSDSASRIGSASVRSLDCLTPSKWRNPGQFYPVKKLLSPRLSLASVRFLAILRGAARDSAAGRVSPGCSS